MQKKDILLVDDHEVVRLGLKALLEHSDQFQVVAEAGTAKQAIEMVEKYHPDVVLMDIRLPGASGIDACQEITERWPDVRVVMLTSYAEDEMLFSNGVPSFSILFEPPPETIPHLSAAGLKVSRRAR